MSPCQRDASRPVLRKIPAALGIILLCCSTLLGHHLTTEQDEFFESKVRPLLARNCYQCHSEQAKILYSNLRVDGRGALLDGGARGPAIVPGDPASSQLIQAVRYENLEMPPAGRLSEDQIDALVKWVEMGAPWPDLEMAVGDKGPDEQGNLPLQSEPLGLEAGAEGLTAYGPGETLARRSHRQLHCEEAGVPGSDSHP